MLSTIKSIQTRVLAALAATTCHAEEPIKQASSQSSVQTALSSGAGADYRYQLKFPNLTFTALSTPATSIGGAAHTKADIIGMKYQQDDFSFELNSRSENTKLDFRSAAEIQLGNQAELGVVALSGKRETYSAAYGSIRLSEQIRFEATADTESDFRARTLFKSDKYQLSLTLGSQDSSPLTSLSFNTKSLWLSAQYGEKIPAGIKLAVGNIKNDMSRNFEAYRAAGKNELADFPDIHTVPFKNSIGSTPAFRFGGKTPITFLGEKPGDMALMSEWRENSSVSAELALRLPDLGMLKQPYIMPGFNLDLRNRKTAFTFETGTKIGNLALRLRSESSEDDSTIGVLSTFKY